MMIYIKLYYLFLFFLTAIIHFVSQLSLKHIFYLEEWKVISAACQKY